RDLGLPHGLLHDRAPVVRAHRRAALGDRAAPAGRPARESVFGHSLPPKNAAATPTASATDASAVDRHSRGRCFVGTTGSGGRPYTSGSSSSRKNAPKPPTPSFGSWP